MMLKKVCLEQNIAIQFPLHTINEVSFRFFVRFLSMIARKASDELSVERLDFNSFKSKLVQVALVASKFL